MMIPVYDPVALALAVLQYLNVLAMFLGVSLHCHLDL